LRFSGFIADSFRPPFQKSSAHQSDCPLNRAQFRDLPITRRTPHSPAGGSTYNRAMARSIISTDGAPAAIGPYSQGVRTGNLIFTAGQGGLDPATGQVVSGGIKEQTARAIENLKAVLEAGGSSLGQVVKANVYLKDINDFAAMNSVYSTYFSAEGDTLPARTTVEAARLPRDLLVEIELVAEV
jgi:2-iminobutanoate/2-iminopropanoate deaminase